MLTIEQIKNKLREVIDPEIGVNIVDLGLIYDIKVKDNNISVLMTLTTPGCPMISMFDREVATKIKQIKGVKKVKVNLTFEPPWTPEKMTKEAKSKLGWSSSDSGNQ